MLVQANIGPHKSAHVVVVGNEKGGSGKSTTAIHVAIALLKAGQKVATIDLDSRQKSLTHYVREPQALGPARKAAARNSAAFLRRPRRGLRNDENEARRIFRLRGNHRLGRAHARFRGDRYAGFRLLSDAACACDGGHADHAAQRQFRRFRRARHRRSGNLCADRHQPLFRNGARRAPPAPQGRPGSGGLDRGAQPPLHARFAQQAAAVGRPATSSGCSSASARPTASPSAWSTANSSRAG